VFDGLNPGLVTTSPTQPCGPDLTATADDPGAVVDQDLQNSIVAQLSPAEALALAGPASTLH
jgi:hypothetical protein